MVGDRAPAIPFSGHQAQSIEKSGALWYNIAILGTSISEETSCKIAIYGREDEMLW